MRIILEFFLKNTSTNAQVLLFFFFAKAPVSNEQPCYGRMALKHVISYVKQMTSPGLMHDTGCSGLVHRDDPEGWDGEGGGSGVQDGEHIYTHG